MNNIHQIADYITILCDEANEELSHLKLQKLLYYVQAWYLAFTKTPLFPEKFQAWIHGPVSRAIYDRFAPSKSLYGTISRSDVRGDFDEQALPEDIRLHVENVLEVYGKYTGTQLEELTHKEDPWVAARRGYKPSERCEVIIDEKQMGDYYRQRLAS